MDRARFARLVVLAAVVVQVAGCGDDDRRPIDSDAGGRDGGARDSGPPTDGGGGDAGGMGMDGGPGVDAGPDFDAGPDLDAGPAVDAGGGVDAGTMATDAGPGVDAGVSPDAMASAQIAAARAALDGTTDLPIEGAYVTYLKPAVGGATGEPAGFFVQALPTGPALYVEVDPTTLTPAPAAGDRVSFHVTRMATAAMQRRATAVSTWTRLATGLDLTPLVQDLTDATDVVSGLNGYESEYVVITATISGAFIGASAGHVAAPITTAGYPTGDALLRLRVPTTVQGSLDLAMGCDIDIGPTPLWRFNATAQPSGWVDADIAVTSCPAPRVVSATALSATSVQVNFDRNIAAATVMASGAQFVITGGGGLAVSAAAATGPRAVTLTTAAQTSGTTYTVTVAATVRDTLGTGIDAAANTAMFTGFASLAVVRINELNANITGGCDLIELRVVSGGSMEGFQLWERTGALVTFSGLTVATNDIIVVHMNSPSATCNPGTSVNETTSKTQQPVATFAANYDAAWDWYSTDTGITNTDNVITLYGLAMAITDAVFVADAATGTAAAATETQAATVAAAGQWTMVGGGVPAGGFIDTDFRAHAALDLNGTGTAASGDSIQRLNNADTNTMADWTQAVSSFGSINGGQTPF